MEEPARVLVVLLRVAAAVHVEDHPARAVGRPAVVGEGEAEMRLPDSGRAVDDGHRAGQEATTEHRIEPGKTGRDARSHEARFYTTRQPARPFVLN